MRNNGRFRNAAPGAETSGRGWMGAGLDAVQVDGVPLRERRWGTGETERCYDNKRLLMGVLGWRQEKITIQKQLRICSSPRFPLSSNSLVCIENNLFIVGIGPIIKKELEFIF